MTSITRRLTTTTAALTLGILASALTTGSAQAATYTVSSCSASNPTATGWTPALAGSPWTYYGENCAAGGMLQTWFDPAQPHGGGTVAQWSIDAPADTTFTSLSAYREWKAAAAQTYGDSHAIIATDKGRVDGCTLFFGCHGIVGHATWNLDDARHIVLAVQCTGSGCPTGEVYNRVKDITLTLSDPHAPTLSDVGGPLTSPNTTARHRTLSYNATDKGGGIYRRRLVIDGAIGAPTVIDANGGECRQPAARRVPCKLAVADSFSFDTAALIDGTHTIAVRVSDITDVNVATTPTWTILVDNQPPAMTAPTITGSQARVGTPLTCKPGTIDGQSHSLTYQWLRANADGSGETAIPDVTTATYTPSDADTGRKLLCRVAATDGGGTTTRTSTITSGPFSDGRTVLAYCDGQPTGPTDPCGDFDGDGIPNHADPDADGDGIPDDRDPRPFHDDTPPAAPDTPAAATETPARPDSTHTTTSTHSSTTQTVVVAGNPDGMPVLSHRDGINGPANNGQGATERTAMTLTGARSRSVVWGRRIATVGRLLNANGQPIAGAVVTIQERAILPRRAGYAPNSVLRTVGSIKTDTAGRFRWTIPTGVSREILYTYKANLANTTVQGLSTLRLTVRSKVTLKAKRRTLHNGDTLHLTGRVHNRPLPSAGVVVNVQAHVRGRGWVVFASPRTDAKGRFTARYRFRDTTRTTRYRIRAITRLDTGAPFLANASRAERITVRP